ncbi:MAG TPA: Verru_Chthon cassette protein B [Verrucomicrobium sp.]|nr:Verru_Chthon cassette protein B [Verrucomicrobium sp.]
MKHLISANRHHRRGFSLVEVVLAVGIAATTVVLLISLLPSGLDQMRASSNQMATARILRWISQDLQMRDFDEWANTASGIIYKFDAGGDPVQGGKVDDVSSIYTVQVSPEVSGSTSGVDLPGNARNGYLRQAIVAISDRTSGDPFADPSRVWKRAVTVVRMEKSEAAAPAAASL